MTGAVSDPFKSASAFKRYFRPRLPETTFVFVNSRNHDVYNVTEVFACGSIANTLCESIVNRLTPSRECGPVLPISLKQNKKTSYSPARAFLPVQFRYDGSTEIKNIPFLNTVTRYTPNCPQSSQSASPSTGGVRPPPLLTPHPRLYQ